MTTSIAEAVVQALKAVMLPEILEMKQTMVQIGVVLNTTVARLDRMQQEMDRRFEQMDKRFEQIERRIEETRIEHSKRMDLLEARIVEVRTDVAHLSERHEHMAETVGRLAALVPYLQRTDELAIELREQRRRIEYLEDRVGSRDRKRLPKASGQ